MTTDARLFFGGEIYTVDEAYPAPEAVAVSEGRIVAAGSESTCRSELGSGYEETDLKGRALLPGFIDSHMHPAVLIYFEMNTDLREATSIPELQRRVREAAAGLEPERWVVGLKFDEQNLAEGRLPTRHDLDAACPDRPAIVIKHDGHTVIGNTRAIEAAGVSAQTPDPAGGVIDREADGSPAGPFRENAARLLLDLMPLPEIDDIRAGAAATVRKLTGCGITSVGAILQTGDEGPAGAAGAFDIPLMQALLDQIHLNLYGIIISRSVEKILEARETSLHDPTLGAGHRIGGLKIFSDGTFGSCSAYMREPFTDRPDTAGFLVTEREELYRLMVDAHTAGLQIATHAIGDAANRECIDLYARLLEEHPRMDHRHRLEHASLLDTEMITDLARLGLVVSTQPLFMHSEKGWIYKRIGEKRARYCYPLRSLLSGGVKVAGASDAPVESPDVLHAIQCCVTREGFEPQQGITAAQAIRMYTIDAAYAQFEESVKGSITPGKRADLIVLSANPAAVSTEEIRSITVEETIVGGRRVYDAASGRG